MRFVIQKRRSNYITTIHNVLLLISSKHLLLLLTGEKLSGKRVLKRRDIWFLKEPGVSSGRAGFALGRLLSICYYDNSQCVIYYCYVSCSRVHCFIVQCSEICLASFISTRPHSTKLYTVKQWYWYSETPNPGHSKFGSKLSLGPSKFRNFQKSYIQ